MLSVAEHHIRFRRRHQEQPAEHRINLTVVVGVDREHRRGDQVVQRGREQVDRPVRSSAGRPRIAAVILKSREQAITVRPCDTRQILTDQLFQLRVRRRLIFGEPRVHPRGAASILERVFRRVVEVVPRRRDQRCAGLVEQEIDELRLDRPRQRIEPQQRVRPERVDPPERVQQIRRYRRERKEVPRQLNCHRDRAGGANVRWQHPHGNRLHFRRKERRRRDQNVL